MTMMQKIQAKKSKKGFTLVELVIVIAILAILAAIAIPVITTTINSAKLSTMESDAATLNMLVKECVNTSKASIKTTTYGTAKHIAADATVGDICESNNLGQDKNGTYPATSDATGAGKTFFSRAIGNDTYTMVYTKSHNLEISGGKKSVTTQTVISYGTKIAELEKEGTNNNNNNGD